MQIPFLQSDMHPRVMGKCVCCVHEASEKQRQGHLQVQNANGKVNSWKAARCAYIESSERKAVRLMNMLETHNSC